MDYNGNDATQAQQQTAAVLTANPDITGAGLKGAVQVALFDASEINIEYLRAGTVTQVIAQKPADMGYMAVITAMANARGVTSMPKRVPTGYAVITADNVDDPAVARFIYTGE